MFNDGNLEHFYLILPDLTFTVLFVKMCYKHMYEHVHLFSVVVFFSSTADQIYLWAQIYEAEPERGGG